MFKMVLTKSWVTPQWPHPSWYTSQMVSTRRCGETESDGASRAWDRRARDSRRRTDGHWFLLQCSAMNVSADAANAVTGLCVRRAGVAVLADSLCIYSWSFFSPVTVGQEITMLYRMTGVSDIPGFHNQKELLLVFLFRFYPLKHIIWVVF